MEPKWETEQLVARNAELEQLLLQRSFELEILSELSHQVSYLLCDIDLLSLLINSLDRVLPIDVAAGMISAPGNLQLILNSSRPLSTQVEADIQSKLLAGLNLMNGQTLVGSSISVQRNKQSIACSLIQRLESTVMVPMLVGTNERPYPTETVGMLLIGATAQNAFTQNHLRFLYTVANQGAVSLGRLRSHLCAEKRRLEQVTTHFAEGVFIVNGEGHLLFSNQAAQGYLEQLGDFDENQRLRSFAREPLSQWLFSGDPQPHWQDVRPLDPTQPPLKLMVQFPNSLTSTECYTLIIREDKVIQDLERLKDQLIGTISHELRTPLTLVYAPLEMLSSGQMGSLTEEGMELLTIAIQSANQLKSLIERILTLCQLESGLIKMQFEPCSAKVLAEKAISLLIQAADQKGIALPQKASSIQRSCTLVREPYICWADPDYILEVLQHLLNNAIKFSTPDSEVRVEVVDQTHSILFSVTDQGMGIPEDHLSCIFNRFEQGDSSKCRTFDGLGIGLALCERIVHLHGGEIWVESVVNQGSTFHFTIPTDTRGI